MSAGDYLLPAVAGLALFSLGGWVGHVTSTRMFAQLARLWMDLRADDRAAEVARLEGAVAGDAARDLLADDSARLDWMDEHTFTADLLGPGEDDYDSLREAVDAAMARKKGSAS